ncbi:MAG: hypothetical protein RJA57_1406 [Bacteroidota bacterium]
MYYVYILQSLKDGRYYKGQTNDLDRRLNEHNRGEEKSTAPYIPWKLVWSTALTDRADALALEKKIKNITRRARLQPFIKKYV